MDALVNGERQIAPEVSGIRRDHVARYEYAARILPANSLVLDLACGVGYGCAILAGAGHRVTGADRSADAIAYARAHYAGDGIGYVCADAADFDAGADEYDAAVCFETIEHLADPTPMLRALRAAAPRLVASVPNETVFPYRCAANHHQGWAHHVRHYTKDEFAALLFDAGWTVTDWLGQLGPESDVGRDIAGRTLIAVAERRGVTAAAAREAVPGHVSIVGLGPSCAAFFELTRRLGGASAYCDEVWGVNAIGGVLACDRIFHMDDVRVQEARAAARPESNIAAMIGWLKTHPGPVYTSVVRDGYPGLVAFPLQDVLNGGYDSGGRPGGGAPYFNSTAAYAIAYAIHIGVRQISLFGLDYTMANAHRAEQGRACCEFWLGIAAARGIEITVPEQSSLLDACAPERERLYGYDCVDVHIADRADGSVAVSFTDRDPPTAAEVEARYDHSRHPNRIVEKEMHR